MVERLTSEEARTVELSKNPIRRLGQLAEYGSAFYLRKQPGSSSPFPLYMTRGDLVRIAEIHEDVVKMMGYESLDEIE